MFLLSSDKRKIMGENARIRAIEHFDEKIVISHYKNEIDKIINA